MNPTRTFIIRRTFVVPMALVIILTAVLLVVCLVQGQAITKVIILVGLIMPLVVLFVETAFRRVVVDQEGVTAFRLFRQRRVLFSDVTELDSVRVRSRCSCRRHSRGGPRVHCDYWLGTVGYRHAARMSMLVKRLTPLVGHPRTPCEIWTWVRGS